MTGHCLRVELLSAANLPRMDFFGTCDPYVIVTAQSKSGLQMFRSDTIHNSQVRRVRLD